MGAFHIASGIVAASVQDVTELFENRAPQSDFVVAGEYALNARIGEIDLDEPFGDLADAVTAAERFSHVSACEWPGAGVFVLLFVRFDGNFPGCRIAFDLFDAEFGIPVDIFCRSLLHEQKREGGSEQHGHNS